MVAVVVYVWYEEDEGFKGHLIFFRIFNHVLDRHILPCRSD